MCPVLFAILAWAPSLNNAATDGVVIFTRKNVVIARSWEMTSQGNIEAATNANGSVSVAGDDMLALSSEIGSSQPLRVPRFVLRNGEVIAASPAESQHEHGASFSSPLWGEVHMLLEQIARYVAAPAIAARVSPSAPYLLLKNGDVLTGGVKRFGAEDLVAETEFGNTSIALSTVATVVLSNDPPPEYDRDREVFLVELFDGQRIYCDHISAAPNGAIVLQRGQARCEMRPLDVRRAVWPGTIISRPSAMEFTSEGVGYFGQEIPVLRNRNAFGQPLRIGDRWFEQGIGCRARSRIAFELGRKWTYFYGRVGLDPWLGRKGDCVVEVKADGCQLFTTQLRNGQDSSTRVTIPLNGVDRLELVTGFGPAGDLGDYVNWCDLILVGGKQGEAK